MLKMLNSFCFCCCCCVFSTNITAGARNMRKKIKSCQRMFYSLFFGACFKSIASKYWQSEIKIWQMCQKPKNFVINVKFRFLLHTKYLFTIFFFVFFSGTFVSILLSVAMLEARKRWNRSDFHMFLFSDYVLLNTNCFQLNNSITEWKTKENKIITK